MKNVLLIHGFNGIPKIFEYFKNILEELFLLQQQKLKIGGN